ncbi:MAG: exo-alpha-sialidase, partial [Chloroflexi bacterium]|nr:exo-alpha-sialidase [Chloroflexota bacterium]
MDGGDTWEDISRNEGLPKGLFGRLGVTACPSKPGRVYATVEADEPGLFRSEDYGDTWELVSDDRDLQGRPWYYQHVFADPQDADTVWILNYQGYKSIDGGKTFNQVSTPHGDNHDLWIDPRNPQRIIEGNDGGACISFNGGTTWSTIYNQPTAEFYRIATDSQFPYRVCGTQQDNSAISVPSRSYRGAIHWVDVHPVGSSESGHIAVKPDDPNIIYSGAVGSAPGGGGILLRYDHGTGQVRMVTVWPENYTGVDPKAMKYRFSWTFPIAFSPHDPNVLYVAGNIAFRSTDEGTTWEAISPDLTRNDPGKQEISGGPITKDGGSAEVYCTIYAFAESPHEPGVLWAGSDDGLVHVSRDAGKNWQDVTPPEIEPFTMVHTIELSPHAPATAYVAATRYKHDDSRPMLYKTNDYGATWQKITNGIPDDDFTRVVREDPGRRGLLYAGTETGVYVSLDDGESWQSMRGDLPVVPVYDLKVKDGDLVAGTHGRSFWIMDDVSPLQQVADDVAQAAAHLMRPRDTYRLLPQSGHLPARAPGKNYYLGMLGIGAASYERQMPDGTTRRVWLDAGQNPADGVVMSYYLRAEPEGEVTLRVVDSAGREAASFSSKDDGLRAKAGMSRSVWNMHYPDAEPMPGGEPDRKKSTLPQTAPLAPPGTYRVELTVDGETHTQSFDLLKDPRSSVTQEELEEQFELLVRVRDKLSETRRAVGQARRLHEQVEEWERRVEGESKVSEAAKAIKEKLSAINQDLAQDTRQGKISSMALARLNEKLVELPAVVSSTDARPTRACYDVFEDLSARVDAQLDRLREVIDTDIRSFAEMLREIEIPLVVP